jgi:hypothetical protein
MIKIIPNMFFPSPGKAQFLFWIEAHSYDIWASSGKPDVQC